MPTKSELKALTASSIRNKTATGSVTRTAVADAIDAALDYVDQGRSSIIDVRDFGAKGGGQNDDTASIQAAINAAATNKGADIYLPSSQGTYIIAGALQDVGGSNSQLVLPKINNAENGIGIRFIGDTAPFTTWGNVSGAILRSTLTTGNGSVIGVKNHHADTGNIKDDISWVSLAMRNLTLRLPGNPSNSGVNAYNLPFLICENFRVDVDNSVRTVGIQPYWNMPEPFTSSSYGIIGSANDNPLRDDFINTLVAGFCNGVKFGELTNVVSLAVCACKVAIEIPVSRHPCFASNIGIYNCITKLKFTGRASVNILHLDIEHNTPGSGGSGPDWVGNAYDIDDPNNYGRGRIVYHMHDDSIPWAVNGAAGLYISKLEDAPTSNTTTIVDQRVPYYNDPNRLYSSNPDWSTDGPDSVWSSPDKKGATNGAIGAFYSGMFTGAGLDIATPVGPAYGSADVYVDNIKVATVSATAPAKAASQVLPVTSGSLRGFSSGSHAYKVVNIGGGTADYLLSDRIDGKG